MRILGKYVCIYIIVVIVRGGIRFDAFYPLSAPTFRFVSSNGIFFKHFSLRNMISVIDIRFFSPPSAQSWDCVDFGPAAKPAIPELHGVVVMTLLFRFTLDPCREQCYENVGMAQVITILRFNLDLFVCFCVFEWRLKRIIVP